MIGHREQVGDLKTVVGEVNVAALVLLVVWKVLRVVVRLGYGDLVGLHVIGKRAIASRWTRQYLFGMFANRKYQV